MYDLEEEQKYPHLELIRITAPANSLQGKEWS